jgi:hypothetical protein
VALILILKAEWVQFGSTATHPHNPLEGEHGVGILDVDLYVPPQVARSSL